MTNYLKDNSTICDIPVKINLNNDYYTLTWFALKNKTNIDSKYIKNQEIFFTPKDLFVLYIKFVFFVASLLITFLLLIRASILDNKFYKGNFLIILLRVFLIYFAITLIGTELKNGYYKLIYTLKYKNKKFIYYEFAAFVCICQIITVIVSIFSIMLWVCTANSYIQPVSGFAALSVITNLDNWIGDVVLSKSIKDINLYNDNICVSEDSKDFELDNYSDKISIYNYNKCNNNVLNTNNNYYKEIGEVSNKDLINTNNILTKNESYLDNNLNVCFNNIPNLNKLNEDIKEEKFTNYVNDKYYINNNSLYDISDLNNRLSLEQKINILISKNISIEIEDCNKNSFFNRIIFKPKWDIIIPLLIIPLSYILPILSNN